MTAATLKQPKSVRLVPRPCFFCGQMMDLNLAARLLTCKRCDVTEAAGEGPAVPRSEAAVSGTWAGTRYVDHAEVHQPTP